MEGIPFTTSYKYLGTWITSKMSMKPQLDHIKKKTDFIVNKLYPLLNEVSLSYRINLWTILLRPLFDQLAQLYTIEKAKSNLLKAERIYKYSFKRFTLLTKRTPDALIYELTGVTLQDRANSITTNAKRKWHERLGTDYLWRDATTSSPIKPDIFLPKEVQTFINLTRSMFKFHRSSVLNPQHLNKSHQEKIPEYKDILITFRNFISYKITINKKNRRIKIIDRSMSMRKGKIFIDNLISCVMKYVVTNS